jgi:hypothetical protein
VEKYYKDNEPKYQEISLKRLFIPRNKPGAKAEDKKPTDEELQAQGEKFRAELEKGADFDKLQKEVYDSQGFTVPPPPTAIPNWRRDSVPPTQLQIFDLKPGQLSKVIVEPAGAYVYRLETKTLIPLDGVKAEIENNLATDRLRAKMDSLTSSIKPEVNKEYFLSLAPESPSGSIPGPGQHMVGPATEATPQPKP